MIRFTLKLLTFTKKSKSYVKLMMIETTGQVTGDLSKMPGLGPRLQKLMHKIIIERNNIVLNDLKKNLKADDPPDSISVFYGAGHMHDLEARIMKELDYKADSEKWLTAMKVDLKKSGLTAADVATIRQTVRAQMQMMK